MKDYPSLTRKTVTAGFWKLVIILAILFSWALLCIRTNADPSPDAKDKLFSLGDKVGQDETKLSLLRRKSKELYKAEKFSQAIPVAQEALVFAEKLLGPDHPEVASALNDLAALYHKTDEYAKAEPLFQRALRIKEHVHGPNHPDTAMLLNNLAALYGDMGDYAKAESLYERALKIREETLGPDHFNTAATINNLAVLYREMGNNEKAKPLYRRALEITEKALGPDDPHTATFLNNLATLYSDMGDYARAEPMHQRALKITENALGPDHLSISVILSNLAELYRETGNYLKAVSLYQRLLKITKKGLGPSHPSNAGVLQNLAELYHNLGNYSAVESFYKQALKIREEALGPDYPLNASILSGLAGLYRETGNYAEAESLYRRALKINEEAFGPDHSTAAGGFFNLARLHMVMGNYARAELLYQRALKIKEQTLRPDHPDTATFLAGLGKLYIGMGNYAKAEPLLQRALQVTEKALGSYHPETATALVDLAELYAEMSDYATAERLLQRALEAKEKTLGPDRAGTAAVLHFLAGLYRETLDFTKAEPLLRREVNIYHKALGPDHPNTARALDNLAGLYRQMGHYARAEPLLQQALKIQEKVFGSDHPLIAATLSNLGDLYKEMGNYTEAEKCLQRALKIDRKVLGPDHSKTAGDINNLAHLYYEMGDFAKADPLLQDALKINEKALGPDHPHTFQALENLALVKIDLGKMQDATSLATQARRAKESQLTSILSFTSEEQRLAFQKTINSFGLPATLGNAAELAETVLRQKGVVLDSLLEDRLIAEASQDPRQRQQIERLREVKQRLMQMTLQIPKDLAGTVQTRKENSAIRETLSNEVGQLEINLARQVAGLGKARRAMSVTVAHVQAALAKQAVLIELIRYVHYIGRGKSEERFGAVLIAPSGEPKWIPLASFREVQEQVILYRKSCWGDTDEATLSLALKALHAQVWEPIEKALPSGTTTIVISPDAELSFISFATLMGTDAHFVAEKYSIRYVASGRDLLRTLGEPNKSQTTIRVFANPDFSTNDHQATLVQQEPGLTRPRSIELRDLQVLSFPSLPGTVQESAKLQTLATGSGWQVDISLGPNATEAELRKINSPRILHLATHGFFLPQFVADAEPSGLARPEADAPKRKLMNSMQRSGLAMAGARATVQAWLRGEVPSTENDGIVTAEEVAGLRLGETWLVVLSACDTGTGEGQAGEGIMGLRRGFVQAGGQNLLMTLWPINDEATVQIMLDFYDAAFKTSNASQALADTQRHWLVKLRNERGLMPAVQIAGPFIMSSQGRQ